ncbi:stage II sporulation protein R [Paenibacillus doosanensis]|uniref:stage II sporulation protein R n=1 Tax=Paenibacillus doosanensis TaxID=1229154 RepID=UPI00217F2821|nr:stage II sporulation protein R [Paenibacillus doosanensis]MCS7460017.1 stage II sporulation protein R [Paenibacillus doosanensis]
MVKRTSRLRYFYIVFALILLISCWEAQRNNAVVYASNMNGGAGEDQKGLIPQESIRLRILANSDSPSDQWVKREVRDAIVEQMKQWVTGPQTIDEARQTVRAHLPELSELVGATLKKNGFSYSYQVELGIVPFPTKMYGNEVYPAGDYEALRVSIGKAEGQNWWCVLFPPLCFVDSEVIAKKEDEVHAQAVPADSSVKEKEASAGPSGKTASEAKTAAVKESKAHASSESQAKAAGGQPVVAAVDAEPVQPEIHFFLWDLLKKLGSLFA